MLIDLYVSVYGIKRSVYNYCYLTDYDVKRGPKGFVLQDFSFIAILLKLTEYFLEKIDLSPYANHIFLCTIQIIRFHSC